jgi:hypothetical protein
MRYPLTDDAIRASLIAAGALDAVHALEAVVSRDSIQDRREYRAGLEALAREHGLSTSMEIPAPGYRAPLPYGPTPVGR